MLAGRRPFEGDSVAAIAAAHVEDDPGRPSDHVAGIDPKLDDITARCLAKRPEDRYPDGRALSEALDTGEDARTRVVGLGAPSGDTMVMSAADLGGGAAPENPESPLRAVLLGLGIGLVLLALAIGVVALLNAGDDPRPADGTPREGRFETGAVQDDPTPDEEPAPPETEPPTTATPEPTASEGEDEEKDDEDTEEDDGEGKGPDGEGPPGQEKKEEKEKDD